MSDFPLRFLSEAGSLAPMTNVSESEFGIGSISIQISIGNQLGTFAIAKVNLFKNFNVTLFSIQLS